MIAYRHGAGSVRTREMREAGASDQQAHEAAVEAVQ
jgi:hypothetical protein